MRDIRSFETIIASHLERGVDNIMEFLEYSKHSITREVIARLYGEEVMEVLSEETIEGLEEYTSFNDIEVDPTDPVRVKELYEVAVSVARKSQSDTHNILTDLSSHLAYEARLRGTRDDPCCNYRRELTRANKTIRSLHDQLKVPLVEIPRDADSLLRFNLQYTDDLTDQEQFDIVQGYDKTINYVYRMITIGYIESEHQVPVHYLLYRYPAKNFMVSPADINEVISKHEFKCKLMNDSDNSIYNTAIGVPYLYDTLAVSDRTHGEIDFDSTTVFLDIAYPNQAIYTDRSIIDICNNSDKHLVLSHRGPCRAATVKRVIDPGHIPSASFYKSDYNFRDHYKNHQSYMLEYVILDASSAIDTLNKLKHLGINIPESNYKFIQDSMKNSKSHISFKITIGHDIEVNKFIENSTYSILSWGVDYLALYDGADHKPSEPGTYTSFKLTHPTDGLPFELYEYTGNGVITRASSPSDNYTTNTLVVTKTVWYIDSTGILSSKVVDTTTITDLSVIHHGADILRYGLSFYSKLPEGKNSNYELLAKIEALSGTINKVTKENKVLKGAIQEKVKDIKNLEKRHKREIKLNKQVNTIEVKEAKSTSASRRLDSETNAKKVNADLLRDRMIRKSKAENGNTKAIFIGLGIIGIGILGIYTPLGSALTKILFTKIL